MPLETGILTTRLHRPRISGDLVPRPRLVEPLEAHRDRPLTLVSAPAGYGKTTLVSSWLEMCECPSAWVSLEANDNDPRRFFSYLIVALHQLGIEIGKVGPSRLETPPLPQAEALVSDLINDVAASSILFLLVLDDYHLIQNEWVHQAVGFLAEHQPPEMHLVLITRVDPPLPLARLRGRGQIAEIRDHELRFPAEEAAWFLKAMEADLPAEAVPTLERRTEGWIVGLQLAAISMRGRKQDDDLAAFIEAVGGTNRYVLDYLVEEALNQQAPAVQDFLIETSILSRTCADLCDAVRFGAAESPSGSQATAVRSGLAESSSASPGTEVEHAQGGTRKSQAILAQLERNNLFLMPLDAERRWYWYHHLLADLVNSTLKQRRSVEQIRELHRRASRWYQAEGPLEGAMIHAMAAQHFERAASMIEENIASMLSRSEAPVLLGWIETLPEQIVLGRPWIDVNRAYTLALNGQLEQVEPLLEHVEKRIEPGAPQAQELLGHIAAIRAYAANLRGDAPCAIEMAALTERYLPAEEHLNAKGMAAYALAETHFAGDDMDGASQKSLRMLRAGEKKGRLLMAIPTLCDLAAIKKVQWLLFQAEDFYDSARQWLVERRGLDSRVRCPYEVGLADLLREWNQLDRAQEHAVTGIEYCRRFGVYSLLVSGYVVLIPFFEVFMDLMAHPNAKPTVTTPISSELNGAPGQAEVGLLYKGGDLAPLLDKVQAEFAPNLKEALSYRDGL